MTVDPTAVGDRIEKLLEASAASGPVVHERAEELVRLVVDLYGSGIERLLEIAYDAGALTDEVLNALAADDLVASLLLVHGLHPYGVEQRVTRALEPYAATLVELTADGVVRLALSGSGCGSPDVAVLEDAILAAAPEVVAVEVEQAAAVIPVDSLLVRLHA